MNPQWTLSRRLTALCLLVATVLTFLAAGAATTAIANRGQLDDLLDVVGPMRAASRNMLSSLVDQEAAVRAYVLHRTEADLVPYNQNIQAEADETAIIAGSPAATPKIRAALGTVTTLTREWRMVVAEPAIAATRSGDPIAAEIVLSDPATERFDEIRRAIDSLQVAIDAVRDTTVDSIRDTSTTLMFVLVVAVVLVIGGAVALLVFLQRAVITPVTDLAGQVRLVARGRYQRAISVTGPPELERLADDVDSMRQRIASDLAEVESARQEIERANLRLEQQAEELVRSNRDLEQFAYVASHDLQEPLRKVSSFCQLLQRRYQGQLDERADQYIAFAVNGAQRMQRLINDLLAFSRIGRATTGFTDVDLNRVVADVAGSVEAASSDEAASPDGASPNGASPDGGSPDGAPEITWSDLPTVRGEEALLATLFANLVGNSLKFRRPDRPPRVRISCRRVDDSWEIGCEDNGIGIDQAFADKVFVIFQRLHPRDAYAGTGIGLAVAKKIVEYHGGHIWIDTDYPNGAAIRFTLPVAAEPVVTSDLAASGDNASVSERYERAKEPVR